MEKYEIYCRTKAPNTPSSSALFETGTGVRLAVGEEGLCAARQLHLQPVPRQCRLPHRAEQGAQQLCGRGGVGGTRAVAAVSGTVSETRSHGLEQLLSK